jgi:hypothetical protein
MSESASVLPSTPVEELDRARLAKVTGGADAGGAMAAMGPMTSMMPGIGQFAQMAMPMISGMMNQGQGQQAAAPSGPQPPQQGPDPSGGGGQSPGSQMGSAPRHHHGSPSVSVNVSVH